MSTIPRVGVTEQLIAALDVPIETPTSGTQRLAQDLAGALGVVTDSAEQSFRRAVYASEQERRKAEALAAAEEQAMRGAGAQRAAEILPQLEQEIAEGRHTSHVGNDGVSVEQYAQDIIAPYTEGADPLMAEEMRRRLGPGVIGRLVKFDALEREKAREASIQAIADSVAGETSPESLTQAAQSARALGLSENEAAETIGLSALAWASERGDEAAWNAAQGFLGKRQSVKQAQLRGAYDAERARQRARTIQEADDAVGALEIEARDPRSPVGYDDIRRAVTERRSVFGDEGTADRLRRVDAREEADLREDRRLALFLEKRDAEKRIVQNATQTMRDARATGGAAMIDRVGFETADGARHELSRQEILDQVVPAELDRIAKETPDPQQAFARQVEFLGLNGVANPAWSAALNGGAMAGVTAFLGAEESGKPPELPATVAAGYDLYKRLKAMDPAVLRLHVQSDDAAVFYARAEAAERYLDKGNPQGALLRAMQATNTPGGPGVDDRVVSEFSSWAGDALNTSEVRGKIKSLASLLVRAPGLSERAAVSEAADLVRKAHTKIGPVYVHTADRNVPPAIGQLSKAAAQRYAAAFPSEGLEPGEMALLPGAVPGQWVLHDLRGAVPTPVEFWKRPMIGSFSLPELSRFGKVVEAAPDGPAAFYTQEEADALFEESGAARRAALRQQIAAENARRRERGTETRRFESGLGRTSPRLP